MSDLEAEIDIGPQITVEYDKSGRATCKSARCIYETRPMKERLDEVGGKKAKLKGAKIAKGALRIVKKVTVAAFGEHDMSANYHLACFMLDQTHARPKTNIVESTNKLTGFDKLKRSDQDLVEKMIERSCRLWRRWKDHNSRRTFTDLEEQERQDEAEDWLAMAEGKDIEERHYDYDQNDINALKKASAAKRKSVAADDDEDDGPTKKKPKKAPAKKKKGGSEDEESDYGDPDRHTDVEESPKKKKSTSAKKEPGVKSEVKKEVKKTSTDSYDTSGYDLEQPEVDAAQKKKDMFRHLMSRPATLGMTKTVPDGAADCLTGLTFVLSGVFDSLTYDEAKNLIEQYGGRVTGGVSKKTSYLLKGDDAGATKTSKAMQLNTPVIDEDGLFDLIRTRPEGGTPAAAPKAKKAKAKPKKKKGSESDEEEEEEEEEESPKKSVVKKPSAPGKRALPSFL